MLSSHKLIHTIKQTQNTWQAFEKCIYMVATLFGSKKFEDPRNVFFSNLLRMKCYNVQLCITKCWNYENSTKRFLWRMAAKSSEYDQQKFMDFHRFHLTSWTFKDLHCISEGFQWPWKCKNSGCFKNEWQPGFYGSFSIRIITEKWSMALSYSTSITENVHKHNQVSQLSMLHIYNVLKVPERLPAMVSWIHFNKYVTKIWHQP